MQRKNLELENNLADLNSLVGSLNNKIKLDEEYNSKRVSDFQAEIIRFENALKNDPRE